MGKPGLWIFRFFVCCRRPLNAAFAAGGKKPAKTNCSALIFCGPYFELWEYKGIKGLYNQYAGIFIHRGGKGLAAPLRVKDFFKLFFKSLGADAARRAELKKTF